MNCREKSDHHNRRRYQYPLLLTILLSSRRIFNVARKLFFKTTPFLSSTINFEQIIPFSLLIDNKTARKRVPSKFRKNLVIDFCTPFPCLKRRRRNKREMARPSLRKRHFKSYVHGHDSYVHRRFLRGKVSGWGGRGKMRVVEEWCLNARPLSVSFIDYFRSRSFCIAERKSPPGVFNVDVCKDEIGVRVRISFSVFPLCWIGNRNTLKKEERREKGYNHVRIRFTCTFDNLRSTLRE